MPASRSSNTTPKQGGKLQNKQKHAWLNQELLPGERERVTNFLAEIEEREDLDFTDPLEIIDVTDQVIRKMAHADEAWKIFNLKNSNLGTLRYKQVHELISRANMTSQAS